MPVVAINRYTCPITHEVAYGYQLPKGWFTIMGEVFSPNAQVPLAQYVVDHPTVGFTELLAQLTASQPAEPTA